MAKNNIIWILALLVITFVGDRAGGWIFKQMTSKSQFRYSRLYNQAADAEILLMGNSRGLIFYQPYIEEKTGKSTFNFSYNALPISLGKVLLEDYLERYENAKLLVIDVTMCDRENKELISGFNLYRGYSDRVGDLIQTQSPKVSGGGSVSHLYRYNGEVFQRSLRYLGSSDEDWLTDRIIAPNLIRNIEESPVLDFNLDPQFIEMLAATVKLAQNKGLRVELVVNPYYPPFVERFVAFENWLSDIEKATGIKVKNYAQSINQLEAFGDYQHLNKAGARMYIDLLLKDGVIN